MLSWKAAVSEWLQLLLYRLYVLFQLTALPVTSFHCCYTFYTLKL